MHFCVLRFLVPVSNGYFKVNYLEPSGWTHVVLNYIGPDNGQGIGIYYNGAEVASDTTKTSGSYSAGYGRIVVGRRYTNEDRLYTSVQVDELVFFNVALTPEYIQSLYNSA